VWAFSKLGGRDGVRAKWNPAFWFGNAPPHVGFTDHKA